MFIFEKLVFESMIENNPLSSPQSGFKPNDSCVNQYVISITHSIFSAFDANPSLKVCGVFLDFSKAFDRVSHEGLLHKLMDSRINGNLLDLIESFLHNRHQSVVLNGQSFDWKFIKLAFHKAPY